MEKENLFIYNFDKQVSRAIQELVGISGQIIYDGKVDDTELNFLNEWIIRQGPYLTKYPLTELKDLMEDILENNIVTENERNRLFTFLSTISPSAEMNPTVEGIFELKPKIAFRSKYFLFTGDMLFGPREKAQEIVLNKGGLIEKSCTQKLNYLIVGSKGSEFWKYGRFGTKITRALELNKLGKAQIKLVQEKDFVNTINKI